MRIVRARGRRGKHRGDNGQGVGSGVVNRRGGNEGDAADGDQRFVGEGAGAAHAFEADDRGRVGFAGGGEDGTDGDVVDGLGVCGDDLLFIVGGKADDAAAPTSRRACRGGRSSWPT